MKIDKILAMEVENTGCINLVRDRLFYQAWELSAFLFIRHIRQYKVHKKRFKNVDSEMVYLGFPKSALEGVIKEAADKGYEIAKQEEDKVVIKGLAPAGGFNEWKAGVGFPSAKTAIKENSGDAVLFLPVYKTAYELTLEVFRFSSRIHRDYKYGLGERLREECTGMLRDIHLMVNGLGSNAEEPGGRRIAKALESARLYLRILKDMKEVNLKRFILLNEKIEDIKGQLCRMQSGPVVPKS